MATIHGNINNTNLKILDLYSEPIKTNAFWVSMPN